VCVCVCVYVCVCARVGMCTRMCVLALVCDEPLAALFDELGRAELTADNEDEVLDDVLRAVDVEKPTDHLWEASRVDLLHVDFNVLAKVVLVQVHDEVSHHVEAVAHDNEWELVSQLGFLQEVLHALGVVPVDQRRRVE
jgi:hypothetical protein